MWFWNLIGVLLLIVVFAGAGAFVQKKLNWPWKK